MNSADFTSQRIEMVQQQLEQRGVQDQRVLEAMGSVPREVFLSPELREYAYHDSPQPIAAGQTISQPYMVAFMLEALELTGGESVLEIGTGSGYATAVLAEMVKEVHTVERIESLARSAKDILESLGYQNVHFLCGDGTKGWPDHAPFDGILVSAGGPITPRSLIAQLKIGGRMVIPVGETRSCQQLLRITRESETHANTEVLCEVRFIPLIGEEGWEAGSAGWFSADY